MAREHKANRRKSFVILSSLSAVVFFSLVFTLMPLNQEAFAGGGPVPSTLQITKLTIGGDTSFDFTVTGPTSFTPSINTVSGTGTTGQTSVTAGTYSIQETIPAGWDLTTASCTDGSSTFSVDTVSGVVINPGNDIECTFENIVSGLTVPDQVTGLIATATSEATIDLSWTAPFDGGIAITGYQIERENPIGGGFTTIVPDTGSTATTFGDTGLMDTTQYNYKISAINAIGTGLASSEADATTSVPPTTLKIIKLIGSIGTFDFTVTGPTSFNPSIFAVAGTGIDGPTNVIPGTYSIQETIPAGWELPTASCTDGSSTFSVDTVSGVVINLGDNIECTFENIGTGFNEPGPFGPGENVVINTFYSNMFGSNSLVADIGNSGKFGHEMSGFDTLEITSIRIQDWQGGAFQPGDTIVAKIWSNTLKGTSPGSEVVEAVSDSVSLSDPKYVNNPDIDITFNFTGITIVEDPQDSYVFGFEYTISDEMVIPRNSGISNTPGDVISQTGASNWIENFSFDALAFRLTEKIPDNVLFNSLRYSDDDIAITENNTKVGQLLTLNDHQIKSFTTKSFTHHGQQGMVTAKIWSGVAPGNSAFVVEAIGDSADISLPPFNQGMDTEVTFNFTNAPKLTGVYMIGLEFSDINNEVDVFTNLDMDLASIEGTMVIQPGDGELWVQKPNTNEDVVMQVNLETQPTLKIIKLTTGGDDTFDFTVAGPTSYNPSINTAASGVGFNTLGLGTVQGDTDDIGDPFIKLGQLVTLNGVQIQSVTTENWDFGSQTNSSLQAVIWSGVSIGTGGEVVEAVSEIINTTGIADFDHTFTFTTTPVLTGSDIVIGFIEWHTGTSSFFEGITTNVGGNEGVFVATEPSMVDPWETDPPFLAEAIVDLPMSITLVGGSGGIGMTPPTSVDPGTYSIQETIPASWNLDTASCDDGSSTFSVDTVSGIIINPGDNIECTFENTFSSLSVPEQVTGLVAFATGTTTIDLAWTAPADGGSPITGYQIERENPIGFGFATIVPTTGSTLTTFTDTGLLNNTQYNYKVSAINAIGTGLASNEADATTFTPEEAADELIDDIADLINEGTLNGGQGSALISQLQNIIDKINNGQISAACNQLDSFIAQVTAYVNGGTLTPAEGQALIDAAQAIKDAANC